MRILLSTFLLFTLALPALAQGPSADWQTIETRHFRIHYPKPYEQWAARAASRIESIRAAVTREVGFEPPQTIDVIITNPVAQANGMALPLLDTPRMVLFAEPPGPDEQIGTYAHWIDLLSVHETTHLVHMLRPTRNPLGRLVEKSFLPLNPITLRAPRWVLEGYATVIEGRLTGSGRPTSAMRALILRRWAAGGRLPTYAQLDSDQRFLGMSMAYLTGSAFLEWLEAKRGTRALRDLWARMTARERRSFDAAFTGVFGEGPERLYGEFVAETTASAMAVMRSGELREGEVFQRTSYASGDPAVSPGGDRLAVVIRKRNTPAKLVVWETGPPEEEKAHRERLSKILERDPEDVAPVRSVPAERKPVHSLSMPDGGDIETPRWSSDGASLLFAHRMPDREGFLHFDLFRWTPASGRVDRITTLADLRDADPLPDGRRAIAIRSRHGKVQLVLVDLASGTVEPLTEASVDVVSSSPRVSPSGEEIVYVAHRGGSWRLELLDLASRNVTAIPSDRGLSFSAPSWMPDGKLVASAASAGFVELVLVSRDGEVTLLTRSAGGAFGATGASDRIYFTSLEPDGFVVRSIARDAPPAVAWPRFDAALVPAVPPPAPQATAFDVAPVPAPRDYGIGRQEFGWLLGQNLAPDQNAIEAGVRFGDVVGRLDTLILGSIAGGGGVEGGAIASAWRGWPVELRLHLFDATERRESEDVEVAHRGAELRGEWSWRSALRSLALQGGALAGDPLDFAFGEAVLGARQLFGQLRVEEQLSLWADHGEGTHIRAFATVSARLGSARLRGSFRHDQLSSDEGASGAMLVGGVPSSIVPESVFARRVLDPALPPSTLTGERYDGWRVETTIAGPLNAFYQRHDTDREGLGLAGVEVAMQLPPSPLAKTPAISLSLGGAKIFDGAMRGEMKYWVAMTWRP